MCRYGLHIDIYRVMDVLTYSMDYQEGSCQGTQVAGWLRTVLGYAYNQ